VAAPTARGAVRLLLLCVPGLTGLFARRPPNPTRVSSTFAASVVVLARGVGGQPCLLPPLLCSPRELGVLASALWHCLLVSSV